MIGSHRRRRSRTFYYYYHYYCYYCYYCYYYYHTLIINDDDDNENAEVDTAGMIGMAACMWEEAGADILSAAVSLVSSAVRRSTFKGSMHQKLQKYDSQQRTL